MPVSCYLCIFLNEKKNNAAKRNVGTGENQIPDMASFASGDGCHSGDGGAPLGAGRGFVMTAEGPTLTGFNSAYRTSSTSDTVSMNYSWWAVGE
ncbi:hypothetical protein [Escherichia coli]|uniref:hypothetical protein n=1 Tax=Escherichia coli TaxID=562 RepID=UPI0019188724|nr:hypothetical protein [Escherichia coli]